MHNSGWEWYLQCERIELCKLMNDTTEGETEEKTHRHYSRKMDILRNKKGRECDKQRASTATYDSMEIHHTETYKSGHRRDTTEENQHREYMETNTEEASDKDKCNTIQ